MLANPLLQTTADLSEAIGRPSLVGRLSLRRPPDRVLFERLQQNAIR
jgi:hypothetical protein